MKKIKNNFCETTLKVRIYGYKNEEVINSAVENGIRVYKVKVKSKLCIVVSVREKDLELLKCICRRNKSKIEVYHRYGFGKVIDFYKNRISLIVTFVFFLVTIGILNSVVWEIKVNTGKYISPYEVKEVLRENHIETGMLKRKVNLNGLEKILKEKCNLSWVDAQIIGGRLIVSLKEKDEFLKEIIEEKPMSLVAAKDGVVSRIYAAEGELLVEPGDIIKKGDYLVGAIQGKEGKEFLVHSEGKVYAKTFYERHENFKREREVVYRTGKKSIQVYFKVFGKKIYIVNNLNKFSNYDKIIEDEGWIKKVTCYETEKQKETIDNLESYTREVQDYLEKDMKKYLAKDSKVLDVMRRAEKEGDEYRVSVILIVEEDIAVKREFDKSQINDIMEIVNEKRRIELENWIKQNL